VTHDYLLLIVQFVVSSTL